MTITIINNDNLSLDIIGDVLDGIQHYKTVELSEREKRQIRNVWKIRGIGICTLVRKLRSKVVVEIFTVDINESVRYING